MHTLRIMFRYIVYAVALLLSSGIAKAQVDLLGMDQLIGNALTSSFPASSFRDQVVSQIPQAIGNGGSPTVTGVNGEGYLIGNGVAGATTASANVNIGEAISTSITWTTTVSWSAYANSNGYVHIQVTVTWGNSSASYTRQIDVPTTMTTSVAASGGGAPITINTTGSSYFNNGSMGQYQLLGFPAQYSYVRSDGAYVTVGYTQWVWVWVPDQGNPGDQNQQ